MKNKIILKTCGAILATLFIQNTSAQSIVDVGVGVSNMDRYITNLAYRHQINDNFRVGFEIQYGSPKYRFVEAKPFENVLDPCKAGQIYENRLGLNNFTAKWEKGEPLVLKNVWQYCRKASGRDKQQPAESTT